VAVRASADFPPCYDPERNSNLFGRATVDEDGQYSFAVGYDVGAYVTPL
jgi:hypothetical protein